MKNNKTKQLNTQRELQGCYNRGYKDKEQEMLKDVDNFWITEEDILSYREFIIGKIRRT